MASVGIPAYRHYHQFFMDRVAALDPKAAVGGLWDTMGQFQLNALRSLGLEPRHTLLDIGCGCLRGGRHLIRYLEPGNYWGLEISPKILEAGRRFLDTGGLVGKAPHLFLTNGFGFSEVDTRKFDFVQAFGVFTDMPAVPVRDCFANLHSVLSPKGVFLATYVPGDRYRADPLRIDFRYPLRFFEDLGHRMGYSVEFLEGVRHPKGHQILAIRRLPGKS